MTKKKLSLLILICFIILLVILRFTLAPVESPAPETVIKTDLAQVSKQDVIELPAMLDEIREKRVLLVGEIPGYQESIVFLSSLIKELKEVSITFLFMLPQYHQEPLDTYLRSGNTKYIQQIFTDEHVLPYRRLVLWIHANHSQFKTIAAVDDSKWARVLKNTLLIDSTNDRIAERIFQEYRDVPNSRIIFLGDQCQAMRAGRCGYNRSNRESVGAKILKLGMKPEDMASIVLSGEDKFPFNKVWKNPAILPIRKQMSKIPYDYFIEKQIYGAEQAGELFDYFINLGRLHESKK